MGTPTCLGGDERRLSNYQSPGLRCALAVTLLNERENWDIGCWVDLVPRQGSHHNAVLQSHYPYFDWLEKLRFRMRHELRGGIIWL